MSEFYCYEDLDVEENIDNWYKNKAGQWVCVGDEDGDGWVCVGDEDEDG